jgi:hypothetical protein
VADTYSERGKAVAAGKATVEKRAPACVWGRRRARRKRRPPDGCPARPPRAGPAPESEGETAAARITAARCRPPPPPPRVSRGARTPARLSAADHAHARSLPPSPPSARGIAHAPRAPANGRPPPASHAGAAGPRARREAGAVVRGSDPGGSPGPAGGSRPRQGGKRGSGRQRRAHVAVGAVAHTLTLLPRSRAERANRQPSSARTGGQTGGQDDRAVRAHRRDAGVARKIHPPHHHHQSTAHPAAAARRPCRRRLKLIPPPPTPIKLIPPPLLCLPVRYPHASPCTTSGGTSTQHSTARTQHQQPGWRPSGFFSLRPSPSAHCV